MENPPFVDHFLRLFPSACHIVSHYPTVRLVHQGPTSSTMPRSQRLGILMAQYAFLDAKWCGFWGFGLQFGPSCLSFQPMGNMVYIYIYMLNHVCPILFIPAYMFELVIEKLNNPLPTLQIAKGRSAMSIHNV